MAAQVLLSLVDLTQQFQLPQTGHARTICTCDSTSHCSVMNIVLSAMTTGLHKQVMGCSLATS
jgi:hypothetical protein